LPQPFPFSVLRSFKLLFLVSCISGCGYFDTEEVMVPAYIYVPSLAMEVNPDGSEGDSAQLFLDAWISSGGVLLGTIGMPALIPVQKSGPTTIDIEAGVARSGQYDTRVKYPFIQGYTTIVDLQPGELDTITPMFSYLPSAEFLFIQDWDSKNGRFISHPNNPDSSDTVIAASDGRALIPGKNSGKLVMKSSSSAYAMITRFDANPAYTLKGFNSPVYLELDYNTNLPLDVYLYYPDQNVPGFYKATGGIELKPTNQGVNNGWNRIYIDFTLETAGLPVQTTYQVYIGVRNDSHITPDVWFDNIKFVRFK
jgi:hypothetical protein